MKLFLSFPLIFLCNLSAEIIAPIPQYSVYNHPKALLGKRLFFEPGLSKKGTIACVNCHQLPGGGADNKAYSLGVYGKEGDINTPSVLNSRYHFVQFWDGRAKTLKDQVSGPISNPKEMASSMKHAVAFLTSIPSYQKAFKKLYPSGITEETLADAISEFEKALITPNSRYDRYLNREISSLTSKEMQGKNLFFDYGCIACHNGITIGGNMYQKIGVFIPYKSDKNQLGRYSITHRESDRYVFKVPSLRNVALTAPYMHDGKASTLKQAIMLMGVHQLGTTFTDNEIDALEAFLMTLTGETPKILLENSR